MSLISKHTQNVKWSLFMKAMEHCDFGSLSLSMPGGHTHHFKGDKPGVAAQMLVTDPACIDAIISQSDIGLGEAYMKQQWQTEDLISLLRYFSQNWPCVAEFTQTQRIPQMLLALSRMWTANTRRGSKRNIEKHYDLGNDFYQLWLDNSMTYSSGIFDPSSDDLFAAQNKKYNRIVDELPSGTSNIVEIGCGWGGFLETAGREGFAVDGLTISKSQAHYATQRMKNKQLDGQAKIKFCDYRDLKQRYDAIVSIEMFEAVGVQYWPTYFQTLKRTLKESGRAVIQTITINNERFPAYKDETDFIQKHIFPGGVLPSPKVFSELANAHGFDVAKAFSFGHSYAQTLKHWLHDFDNAYDKIKTLGFDDAFINKWRFYLAYCIAGFTDEQTDVYQYTLAHKSAA